MVLEKLPVSAPSTQLNKRHQITNGTSETNDCADNNQENRLKTKLFYNEDNNHKGESNEDVRISDFSIQDNHLMEGM